MATEKISRMIKMDFKSLLSKLDSMEAPASTPAAPTLDKAVQLNEDAQLRVLAGQTTYVAEAKKKKDEEKVDEAAEMKTGEKKKSSTGGTIEKTATGVKHTAGKNYSGKTAEKEDKSKKDESIEPQFKSKFMKMVEAKKEEADKKKAKKKMEEGAKPDFLDIDGDGDKKEPMKKAAADKGDSAKKDGEKKGMSDKQAKYFGKKNESIEEAAEMKDGEKKKSSTGGTIEKTKTGLKHTSGKNYSGKAAEKEDKSKKDESTRRAGTMVAESAISFKEMIKLVQESGGQQAIDPIDTTLFAWAQRVAASKYNESAKAEVYAGMLYERNGGRFEMYDVLSEDQK
jgi:hypothetical protein